MGHGVLERSLPFFANFNRLKFKQHVADNVRFMALACCASASSRIV